MQINVLFVDDDPNVIQGFKRSLRSKRAWRTCFAEGGEAALNILAEQEIDIVVADMRMPGIGGAELLKIIQEKYPRIIRMVLSGYTDQELILKSTKLAHQFFAKPCDTDILIKAVEHAWLFRDLVNNERLKDLITGITALPSLSGIYLELLEYIQTPDASIKQIGKLVAQDITMTAKILQLVNSAFFSLPQKVVDPSRAVSLLGIDNLKVLILYIHIFSTFDATKKLRPDIDDLWKHSIAVGRLARDIAILEFTDRPTIENALTTGILHDIGKLVLLYAIGQKPCVSLKDEYDALGTSHAEVGAYLLGLWGIPASIVTGVAYHHRPAESGENAFTALTAVHTADALVSNFSSDISVIPGLDYSCLEAIGKIDRLPLWISHYNDIRNTEGNPLDE
jgi:HD-like signal output (HDOD) protein/ActR/RegA family two-component response regulator